MSGATTNPQIDGSVCAAISNAIVRIVAESTGRGPTRARTTLHDDLVVVLMQDTLTKAERRLLASEEGAFVLEARHRLQRTMREDFTTAVEGLTGRGVAAFMSANHLDPDMCVEMFLLDPAIRGV